MLSYAIPLRGHKAQPHDRSFPRRSRRTSHQASSGSAVSPSFDEKVVRFRSLRTASRPACRANRRAVAASQTARPNRTRSDRRFFTRRCPGGRTSGEHRQAAIRRVPRRITKGSAPIAGSSAKRRSAQRC